MKLQKICMNVLVVFIIICKFTEGSDLEIVFRDRSKNDWEKVWHTEKHLKCRDSLLRHLYWACEKDIYKVTRRSSIAKNPIEINDVFSDYNEDYPWISEENAKQFLRKRRGKSSITAECCKSTGCTWEEYAEYCPSNKRYI